MPIHEAPDGRRVARIRMRRVVSLAATLMLVLTAGAVRAFPAARIYREAADSVVLVFGFEKDGAGSTGTGTVLTRDGLVLTNNHVITQGEGGGLFSSLVVYFKPARVSGDTARDLVHPHPVEVIARDAQLDLALLRVVDPPGALRPIEVGDSEEVEIGEDVAAIGHPRGGWALDPDDGHDFEQAQRSIAADLPDRCSDQPR
jgi:S1-C subfamily serine protease